MKKRIVSILLAAVMALGTVFLSSCGSDKTVDLSASKDGKSAYDLAVENGYKGTVQEWLASLAGENGAAGEKGERGESAYELAVKNGYKGTEKQWLDSLAVNAKNGKDGESAYELAVKNGYTGTELQWLASLVGEAGANGAAGKSAYELAVENGYTGTESQWLASLIGAKGDAGSTGATGKSAYELAVENGFEGTLTEWIESLSHGPKGDKGENGKSAYALAVENGFSGSLSDWLDSLIGATGAQGIQGEKGETGAAGTNGVDGKSAYELACANGFTGTVTQWLASLVGAQGAQGEKGDKGEKGDRGETGAQGLQGEKGEAGAAGADGVDGKSAYELAVENGYTGDLQTWLLSLVGSKGDKGDKGDTGATGKSAYELAVDNGYEGTLTQWIDSLSHGPKGDKGDKGDKGENGTNGTNGADGVSVVGAEIQDGSLYLSLSNSTKICAGTLPKGDKGDKGDAGVGISNVSIDARGHLILTMTDGTTKDAGKVTADGGAERPATFTVTFKDWDGSTLKTQTVSSGASATAPADPVRDGYTFTGWDKSFDAITADTVVTATYVKNATTPALLVGSNTAAAGATKIAIPVSLKNNPGFLTMALQITYDSSALTLTKVTNGSDFSDYNFTAPKNKISGCKAAWFSTDLPEEILDGDVMILQFTVNSDAAAGEYDITVSCPNDGSTVDGSKAQINFSAGTGSITVR